MFYFCSFLLCANPSSVRVRCSYRTSFNDLVTVGSHCRWYSGANPTLRIRFIQSWVACQTLHPLKVPARAAKFVHCVEMMAGKSTMVVAMVKRVTLVKEIAIDFGDEEGFGEEGEDDDNNDEEMDVEDDDSGDDAAGGGFVEEGDEEDDDIVKEGKGEEDSGEIAMGYGEEGGEMKINEMENEQLWRRW